MILDTSFIIDLLNNNPGAVKKSIELDDRNIPVFSTSVTVFEIWQGVSDIKDKNKLNKINTLLSNLGLLSLDVESAKIGGELYSSLERSGKKIDPEDCMIAGICLNNNYKIVTRNVKHFSRVEGLKIESY